MNSAGSILNDGKVEVQGNFSNGGTYTSITNSDTLLFTGSGLSLVNAGNASFTYLAINKSTRGDSVRLGSPLIVTSKFDYLSGSFSTDYLSNPSYVLSAPATAVFNITPGLEIAGRVRRTAWTNTGTTVFNNPQLRVSTIGGTAPSDVTVTMLPQSAGGDPSQAEREVKRKFLFEQTGGANFTADVQFPYAATELNTNNETNLVPWYLNAGEWTAQFNSVTKDVANKVVSVTGIPVSSFVGEWKLADPVYKFNVSLFLRGAWNAGPGDMTPSLNASGYLPLSQPYAASPYNYNGTESVPSIPNANVVDWVLMEFRKPQSGLPSDAIPTTAISQRAGFLLRDGSLVDLDGITPLSATLGKQGPGFVVLRHRNHIAVMSGALASGDGTFLNDFSALGNCYTDNGIGNTPVQLLPGTTKYALWAGNANKDGVVNASDIALVKAQVNGAAIGYQAGDVNLDGVVNASDVGLTKLNANAAATGHVLRTSGATSTVLTSHVPGN
ncbi:hypothetical protein GCM10023229_31890 [Flavisolibacter ginsenosidimutans]